MESLEKKAEKYLYYFDIIRQISEIEIWKPIKIKDLKLGRGIMDKAYSEMKYINFKETIIEYLCFVGLEAFISLFDGIAPKKVKDFLKEGNIKLKIFMPAFEVACRLALYHPYYLQKVIKELLTKDGKLNEEYKNIFSAIFFEAINERMKLSKKF